MGACKSRILIKLKDEQLKELIEKTHFNANEIKAMYKRFWKFCADDGSINKEQFFELYFPSR